jgi:transmembrane sensor
MDSSSTVNRNVQASLENDPLLHMAAEWFFELRSSDVSVERIAEWQEWLAADAANRRAFENIELFWLMSGKIETAAWPTDAEVAADRYGGAASVSEWRQRTTRLGLVRRRPWIAALAASVVGLMAIGAWFALNTRPIAVATQVGETRSLSLPDGSTVAVGGHTMIEARFAERSRDVALERGEAFFHVAKDATRPFVVHAGRAAVTAVGTAFNVRRTESGVIVVAVAEGVVRISTVEGEITTVSAGQQAKLQARAQEPADVVPVDAGSIAGWRDGRLQYMNEPLDAVVEDLARYSSRKILIHDPQVRELRITGIVFQQNVDGWLSGLEATLPVRIVKRDDGSAWIYGAVQN